MSDRPEPREFYVLLRSCANTFRTYEKNYRDKADTIRALISRLQVEFVTEPIAAVADHSARIKEERIRLADTLAKAEVNRDQAERCEALADRTPAWGRYIWTNPDRMTLCMAYGQTLFEQSGYPEPEKHFEVLEYFLPRFTKTLQGMIDRKSFRPDPERLEKTGSVMPNSPKTGSVMFNPPNFGDE